MSLNVRFVFQRFSLRLLFLQAIFTATPCSFFKKRNSLHLFIVQNPSYARQNHFCRCLRLQIYTVFVHIFISSSTKAVRIFFFYSTLSERTLSALVSSAFFTAARSLNPLSAESRAPIAVTAPAMTPAMPEEDSSCPPLTDNKAV